MEQPCILCCMASSTIWLNLGCVVYISQNLKLLGVKNCWKVIKIGVRSDMSSGKKVTVASTFVLHSKLIMHLSILVNTLLFLSCLLFQVYNPLIVTISISSHSCIHPINSLTSLAVTVCPRILSSGYRTLLKSLITHHDPAMLWLPYLINPIGAFFDYPYWDHTQRP